MSGADGWAGRKCSSCLAVQSRASGRVRPRSGVSERIWFEALVSMNRGVGRMRLSVWLSGNGWVDRAAMSGLKLRAAWESSGWLGRSASAAAWRIWAA